MPADTFLMFPSPPILTAEDPFASLLPSWLYSFPPQDHTVPSDRTAMVWCSPALTSTTSDSPATLTGLDWSALVPSPSMPLKFQPQAQTLLSERSATVWCSPAVTFVTPDRPSTR